VSIGGNDRGEEMPGEVVPGRNCVAGPIGIDRGAVGRGIIRGDTVCSGAGREPAAKLGRLTVLETPTLTGLGTGPVGGLAGTDLAAMEMAAVLDPK
jgi:hypothetical protein